LGHSHSICIFDSDATEKDYWQPRICDSIRDYISRGYAVVYVVGQNENATVQNLARYGLPVEDHVESGALTIINRDVFYSPTVSSQLLIEQWVKVFSSIEKKRGKENIKGFFAIGMPTESFFGSEAFQHRLVEYETVAANKYDGGIEARCCYSSEMIERMPLKYVMTLLNAHQNTAHNNGELKQWNSERCLEVIHRGLDEALGAGVSEMIFSILLKDFGMDRAAMVSSPEGFESRLKFLLGDPAADIVLRKVKHELKNATMY
jgi:hypothetical protein